MTANACRSCGEDVLDVEACPNFPAECLDCCGCAAAGDPTVTHTGHEDGPTAEDMRELDRLRAAYQEVGDRAEANPESDALDAACQVAYDALVDHVEACGLNYTEHDPRGPERVEERAT